MKRSLLVVLLLLIVCGLEARGLGQRQWLDVVRQSGCQRLRPLMFVAAERFGRRGWSTPSCLPRRYLKLLLMAIVPSLQSAATVDIGTLLIRISNQLQNYEVL